MNLVISLVVFLGVGCVIAGFMLMLFGGVSIIAKSLFG